MPPIDPFELLKCLGVLLTPIGGIKSPNEVDRISRLMLRFSKKLVSKCIYIQILKATHPDLLQMFLNKEGWSLLDAWLTDGVKSDNKALLNEMLQLLAVCPLEDAEFKQTSIPQTVQSIAQGNVDPVIRESAAHLWSRCYGSKPQMFSTHDTGLPEDIDLSIYAPDPSTSSAGDLYNSVDVSMNNMNYAQYSDMYSVPDTGNAPSMMVIDNSSSGLPANSVTQFSTAEVSHAIDAAAPAPAPLPPPPVPEALPVEFVPPEVVGHPATPADASSRPAAKATAAASGLPVIKIVTKGGMPYVVKKEPVIPEPDKSPKEISEPKEKVKSKEKEKKRDKDKEKEKEKKKSSSSSKNKSSSKDSKTRDKDRKDKEESSKSKDKSKDKSKTSKEDKEKKSKHEAVVKQAEKDRETLAALKAMSSGGVAKLSKIPRKKAEDKDVKEKEKTPSEAAQPLDILDKLQRPKTVKTFNSKFRSTGLEETTKPAVKKPTSPASAVEKKLKRPGVPDPGTSPTEKKPKVVPDDSAISAAVAAVMKKTAATEAKPGVRLISPRPRPLLQDSSLFMDALEAGSKLEPRKRKRRASSGGKDTPTTPDQVKAEPVENTSPAPLSPTLTKPTFKFYQDTLETEENGKDKEEADVEVKKEEGKVKEEPKDEEGEEEKETKEEGEEDSEVKKESAEDDSSAAKTTDGVLVTHIKKKPKKTVRWRSDDELHSYHFFELDENERVNVNKLKFGDMMQAEKQNERQAFQMAKTYVDEEAEEKPWILYLIDLPPPLIVPGAQSRERDIQEARENSTLQALYFKGQILPDYPAEPDPEVPLERTTDPQAMPLDDVTGNPESVYDLRHIPWPEPRIPGQYHPPPVKPYIPAGPDMPPQDYMGPPRNRGYLPENGPPQQHMGPMNRPGMPVGGVAGGGGGGWFTSDGSVFPEPDGGRYAMGGPVRPGPYDYDMMGPGPGFRGPGRGIGMEGPRPRFPGAPPRGPPRSQGPRGGMQPCWHFMRGFCRLENRCKFLHPGFSGPMA